MELSRRVRRSASTRSAGRRGALPFSLGSRIHNAFRSALSKGGGRKRKAVYSVRETELDMPLDLVQFGAVKMSSSKGSLQTRISFAPAAAFPSQRPAC
jgi:hypothetical protein